MICTMRLRHSTPKQVSTRLCAQLEHERAEHNVTPWLVERISSNALSHRSQHSHHIPAAWLHTHLCTAAGHKEFDPEGIKEFAEVMLRRSFP